MKCRENISYTRVCCDAHTVILDVNMSVFDYIIFLYGAVFEFANVTENGTLLWNTYPLPLLSIGDDFFLKNE